MKGTVILLAVISLCSVIISFSIWSAFHPNMKSVSVSPIREDVKGEASPSSLLQPMPTPIPSLTIDRVFSKEHTWTHMLPEDRMITVIATGDVIPARSVNHTMVMKNDYEWPFEKTKDFLKTADITIINLKTPLLDNCAPTVEGMSFCGSSKAVQGLESAGIDIATLGNNHIGNHGIEGVRETERILEDHHITPIATDTIEKTIKGTRFAFLSYNDIGHEESGVPWADPERIRIDVANAKKNADVVIVSFHWGIEYQTQPTVRQQELAHLAVDSGADVILGNHPHWIEPIELYKGKFIMYAHGNFVFDQEWSKETKLGVVGKYTFYEGKLVDVEYVPIRIVDYGQPYILPPEESLQILMSLKEASGILSTRAQ